MTVINHKTASTTTKVMRRVWIFLHGRTFNKHQMLFHLSSNGPVVLMHVAKQCLFGSVVCLAVIAADLWDTLWEIHPALVVAACIPPILTILMMPTTIQTFNMVTSIESMKHNNHISDVIIAHPPVHTLFTNDCI